MKMVIITYNEALDGEVAATLSARNIAGFTKWKQAYGTGQSSGPHFGTTIWPKSNNIIMTVIEDAQAVELMNAVRSLRQSRSRDGIKAFLLPCEDMT